MEMEDAEKRKIKSFVLEKIWNKLVSVIEIFLKCILPCNPVHVCICLAAKMFCKSLFTFTMFNIL